MKDPHEEIIENYLKICKENFDSDRWFGCTSRELYENPDKIGETWKINHGPHNFGYLGVLYKDISMHPEEWNDKTVLDYGCGFGGNLVNLHKLTNWSRYIGYDISPYNVVFTKEYLNLHNINSDFIYETNGFLMSEIMDETVDFATSFIVFQHIAFCEIKLAIFREMYRVLKKGGIFSFHMNRWDSDPWALDYKTSCRQFTHPISYDKLVDIYTRRPNCVLTTVDDIKIHLQQIGFEHVEIILAPNPAAGIDSGWVYIKAIKTSEKFFKLGEVRIRHATDVK